VDAPHSKADVLGRNFEHQSLDYVVAQLSCRAGYDNHCFLYSSLLSCRSGIEHDHRGKQRMFLVELSMGHKD